jgi:hypothetical protein
MLMVIKTLTNLRAGALSRSGTTRPQQTEAESELAARGSGKELAQCEKLGKFSVRDPLPPLDEFAPEIAEMGDRAAEGRQAKLQERREDLADTSRPGFARTITHGCPGA